MSSIKTNSKHIEVVTNPISASDCSRCENRLREKLHTIRGIDELSFLKDTSQVKISYDPNLIQVDTIREIVKKEGAQIDSRFRHEDLELTGLDCPDCASKVEKSINNMKGIEWCSVNYATSKMFVEFMGDTVSLSEITSAVHSFGYDIRDAGTSTTDRKMVFNIRGMDCADCAAKLEKQMNNLDGVHEVWVDFNLSRMTVKYKELPGMIDRIIHLVDKAGYSAILLNEDTGKSLSIISWIKKDRKAISTSICGLFILLGYMGRFTPYNMLEYIFFGLAMLAGGFYTARAGFTALRYKTIDMNFLMSIAVAGAVAIGEWEEAAMVVFLFSLGNVLQNYTMDKTRNSLKFLMDLSPKEARIKKRETIISVPVANVNIADIMIVLPGEKIAMDGIVTSGESEVNQAPITGESIPVVKIEGNEVFAGTINGSGMMEVRITKLYEETTLSKIIHLVEEAQAQKAPSQLFVDKFAKYYTPAVIITATLIVALPVLLFGGSFNDWFYKGLMLLVISCPCALVISTPVSIVSAIGNASRNGVLIKGGAYLEEAGKINVVAFDKTGTLTKGHAGITDIIGLNGLSETEVLQYAASIEQRSEHPIGRIIKMEADVMGLTLFRVSKSKSLTGKGVESEINGKLYYVGSHRLADETGIEHTRSEEELMEELESSGKTVLLVADQKKLIGIIALRDMIREESRHAIAELKSAGIKRIIMLTGDNRKTAEVVAKDLGIDEFRAQLLPEDKVDAVKELRALYGNIAMVGEGINDAPALAASDVAIALGVAGTDTALETADIALMSDDMSNIPFTLKLSRKALGIIKGNIAFSLIVKAAFFVLVFSGLSNLWMAVLADTGTSLIVIANGMRLLRFGSKRKNISELEHAHSHESEETCGCGQDHDHEHDEDEHEHMEASACGCGHDHHEHHEEHDHEDEHTHKEYWEEDEHKDAHYSECGCGHDHEHGHKH
ncbi:MAG: cadmium-translocating P-type ATPase [Candidatus Schekmanbacteria bacterium]|nr:cadmium-translocating P-type ATPase [Candidatus Schekmanbacteria bacterium]